MQLFIHKTKPNTWMIYFDITFNNNPIEIFQKVDKPLATSKSNLFVLQHGKIVTCNIVIGFLFMEINRKNLERTTKATEQFEKFRIFWEYIWRIWNMYTRNWKNPTECLENPIQKI